MHSWKQYLPSSQFIGVATPIVIGLLITFGLMYLSYPDRLTSASATEERADLLAVATEALIQSQFKNLDSDGDGLYDWEEVLWGTDPHNPDTSGDGMLDGEAVRQGRDPLVPGPDNFLINTRGIGNGATGTSSGQTGARTERLARNFLGSYLALKQGGAIDDANQQRLVENLVRTSSADFSLRTYKTSDFTILNSVTEVERLAYYNTMKSLYEDLAKVEGDDLVLLYRERGGDAGNPMQTYNNNLAIYTRSVETLIETPVPLEARLAHVPLTNALANYAEILTILKDTEADPVSSIYALQQYESALQQVLITGQGMRQYFTEQGYTL